MVDSLVKQILENKLGKKEEVIEEKKLPTIGEFEGAIPLDQFRSSIERTFGVLDKYVNSPRFKKMVLNRFRHLVGDIDHDELFKRVQLAIGLRSHTQQNLTLHGKSNFTLLVNLQHKEGRKSPKNYFLQFNVTIENGKLNAKEE